MTFEPHPPIGADPNDFVLTRVFDAPRELVWKVWADAKHVAVWWGPHGFTNPVCEVDLRPGGTIWIDMRGPDGKVYPMRGEFREIVEPERIVFFSAIPDDKGKTMFEVLTTVTFAEQGRQTLLTVEARVLMRTPAAASALEGMEIGWSQMLERMAAYLQSNPTSGDPS